MDSTQLLQRAEFYWQLAADAADDQQSEQWQDLALMFERIVRDLRTDRVTGGRRDRRQAAWRKVLGSWFSK